MNRLETEIENHRMRAVMCEKYRDKIEAYDIEGHKSWGQKRRCTNCGFIHTYIEDFGIYPFCPNCNALMWKEGEQHDR